MEVHPKKRNMQINTSKLPALELEVTEYATKEKLRLPQRTWLTNALKYTAEFCSAKTVICPFFPSMLFGIYKFTQNVLMKM